MRSLLLHSTSTAQWQALLFEAQQTLAIELQEDLEAYLVFMLTRFVKQPELCHSVLGLEFLESTNNHSQQQSDLLRILGDKCLLFAGLFPDRAQKRRVTQQYYIQLGKAAYMNLANTTPNHDHSVLFSNLCQEFLLLTDILQATREVKHYHDDLMTEIERWQETGSHYAWLKIQQATQSIPMPTTKRKFDD